MREVLEMTCIYGIFYITQEGSLDHSIFANLFVVSPALSRTYSDVDSVTADHIGKAQLSDAHPQVVETTLISLKRITRMKKKNSS